MAPIKVAVWSAVVEPGKELAIVVPKDFTLTNAALGEDLADPKGRSVLKLTHIVIPDKFLRTPDDYSDLEDEEDEEEEEEDEEDPEASFEDTTTVLTSLTAGRTEQSQLNLTFNERDELIFTVSGSNIVHLSGNYIDQSPEEDSDMDQDPDSDDYDSDMDPEDFDEEDEDESMDDEEAAGKITELPEPTNGKRSAETSTEELSKSQKKKLNKKLKGESGEAAPAPAVEEKKAAAPAAKAAAAPAPKAEVKSNKKVHGNGLVTEDSKLGTGAVAKSGKKVGMRYIGKLANGKVFDSNTNGKPFVFVLGKGEVIKGWDLGVAGMAIGGERKLTIPAPLAYGSKALPGIPKNSTLHFEVKLVSVQ